MIRSTNNHKFIMLHFCISIFTNCGTSKKFGNLVSPVLLNQFSISKFMSQCNRKERNLKLSQSPNFKQTNSILSLETHLKTRAESRDTAVQPYSLQINSSAHPELPAAPNATAKQLSSCTRRCIPLL